MNKKIKKVRRKKSISTQTLNQPAKITPKLTHDERLESVKRVMMILGKNLNDANTDYRQGQDSGFNDTEWDYMLKALECLETGFPHFKYRDSITEKVG